MLHYLVSLLKTFIANVLNFKARLKAKFKCATMHSFVMSPFSRDCIKMEIARLIKIRIRNVLTYLHEYSIHTAPDF